jgi:hypothetical protein
VEHWKARFGGPSLYIFELRIKLLILPDYPTSRKSIGECLTRERVALYWQRGGRGNDRRASKTTRLMTVEEAMEMMRKAGGQSYEPPEGSD